MRVETIGSATLYLADCLDAMPGLANASIDLTVTSPPYDNLRTYNGNIADWGEHVWRRVIEELFRITKVGGVVVWVVGDATVNGSETGTSFRQALWAMECGFRLHDTMIYQKKGTGACGSNLAYWQSFEFMFVWSRGKPNVVNRVCDNKNIGVGRSVTKGRRAPDGSDKDTRRRVTPEFSVRPNVWAYSGRNTGWERIKGGFDHPAMFPEALAHDHIVSWSNEGDAVLDPFTGSGTTGKMALLNGRKFIGIEKDAGYFAIACDRIAKAASPQQPDLLRSA